MFSCRKVASCSERTRAVKEELAPSYMCKGVSGLSARKLGINLQADVARAHGDSAMLSPLLTTAL